VERASSTAWSPDGSSRWSPSSGDDPAAAGIRRSVVNDEGHGTTSARSMLTGGWTRIFGPGFRGFRPKHKAASRRPFGLSEEDGFPEMMTTLSVEANPGCERSCP
jgi:hypothetical protein